MVASIGLTMMCPSPTTTASAPAVYVAKPNTHAPNYPPTDDPGVRCASNPCLNLQGHGECGVNAVCACEEGYVGAACELTCPSGTQCVAGCHSWHWPSNTASAPDSPQAQPALALALAMAAAVRQEPASVTMGTGAPRVAEPVPGAPLATCALGVAPAVPRMASASASPASLAMRASTRAAALTVATARARRRVRLLVVCVADAGVCYS